MKVLALLAGLLLLLSPCVRTQAAAPAPGEAQVPGRRNPLPIKDIGDPFILCAEDAYWHFSTTGGMGFQARKSADLITWEKPVYAYVPGPGSWGSSDYWAPEVYAHDGAYYMFYSARWRDNGSLRIGVARADKPDGPYVDITPGPLFDFGYAAIDAHVLFDEGQAYLYYARDCSENVVAGRNESHLYGIRLSPQLDEVQGEPVLLTKPDQAWEMASGPQWLWNEGPYVLKNGGKYWLFYSANNYASKEYGVGAASADTPLGPYVKLESNPLMRWAQEDGQTVLSGPGHNSFFRVGDALYTAYHTHVYPTNPSGYRQTNIDSAGFAADGMPFINGPTLEQQPRPFGPAGPINHMAHALPGGPGERLVQDGDQGMGSADKKGRYAAQRNYAFTWEAPVTIDSLLLYAENPQQAQGHFLLDGQKLPFTLHPGTTDLGRHLLLEVQAAPITRLELVWDSSPAPLVYELLAVGAVE